MTDDEEAQAFVRLWAVSDEALRLLTECIDAYFGEESDEPLIVGGEGADR